MSLKLGIVLINYHSEEEVVNYIKRELSKIKLHKKIVIINNSYSRRSEKYFNNNLDIAYEIDSLDYTKRIFLINQPENLGYARANNLGAQFLNQYFSPEFILFSNSDIKIEDSDVIEELIKVATQDKRIAVVGPRIVGIDSKEQSPHRYISFFKRYIFKYLLFPITLPWIRRGYFDDLVLNAEQGYYYRLMGCFHLVKAKLFFEAGLFDNRTFLYSEEKIFAERLKVIGGKMYYYPAKKIIHEESQIVGKRYSEKKKWSEIFKSDSIYYKEYIKINPVWLFLAKASLFVYFNFYWPIFKILSTTVKRLKHI